MVGFCFFGTTRVDQYGIQAVQGTLFILISENTFAPMYSALTLFPKRDPLFMRERQAGLYNTFQYFITNIIALVIFYEHTFTRDFRIWISFMLIIDSGTDCWTTDFHHYLLFLGWFKANGLCICNDINSHNIRHEHCNSLWYDNRIQDKNDSWRAKILSPNHFRLLFLNRIQFSGCCNCVSCAVWCFSHDNVWCFYKTQVRPMIDFCIYDN